MDLIRSNRPFRVLLAARTASHLGDGVALVALILYVQAEESTGTAVGALLLAAALPRLLGPVAGTLADAIDGRTMMIVCDVGQTMVYGVIAIWLPPLPILLALVAVASILEAAFNPASRAAVTSIVERDALPSANAWLGSTLNLQVAAGPLMGGALVAASGFSGAIAANALTFLLSALLLLRLPSLEMHQEGGGSGGLLSDTRAGLGFAMRHRTARAVVVSLFLGVAFGAIDNVALVFLAREELGAGPVGFGAVNSAFGVGMLIASALLINWGGRIQPRNLFLLGWVLTGVGTVATGFAPTLALAALLQALAGIGNAGDNVASDTLIQQHVPRRMLGRVFGLVATAASVGGGIAYAAGGPLLDATSPRFVFILGGGLVLAVVVLAAMLLPSSQELESHAGYDTPV